MSQNEENEALKGYVMTDWEDHIVDPIDGEILQQGTPVSARNMNKIEQGIYDAYGYLASLDVSNTNNNELTEIKNDIKEISDKAETIQEICDKIGTATDDIEKATLFAKLWEIYEYLIANLSTIRAAKIDRIDTNIGTSEDTAEDTSVFANIKRVYEYLSLIQEAKIDTISTKIDAIADSKVILNNSSIKSIQRGRTTVPTSATSTSATISAVNTNKCELRYLGSHSGILWAYLSSSTSIAVMGETASGAQNRALSWELTEYY